MKTFDQFLIERNLKHDAELQFNIAARNPMKSEKWYHAQAHGHELLSQYFDSIKDTKRAKEHHQKSSDCISALEKLKDK